MLCKLCDNVQEPLSVTPKNGDFSATYRCDTCTNVWKEEYPFDHESTEIEEVEATEGPDFQTPEGDPLKWSAEERDGFIEANGRPAFIELVGSTRYCVWHRGRAYIERPPFFNN